MRLEADALAKPREIAGTFLDLPTAEQLFQLMLGVYFLLGALGDVEGAAGKLAEARYLFGDKDDLRPFIGLDCSARLQIQ